MKDDLRNFQKTNNSLQTFIANKMQRSQAAVNSPPPASLLGHVQSASHGAPGTVHIVNTTYNIFTDTISNSGSNKPGKSNS